MKIPSNNNWTQLNSGDIVGVLNETHNVTFDTQGVIKQNFKSVATMNDIVADGGNINFEQVMGTEIYSGDIYAITDDSVFRGDLDGDFFVNTNADLDTRTESVVCFGRLYAVDGDEVDYWNGSSWTTDAISSINLSTANGVKHPMAVFDSLPTYKLAIGDANVVRTFNSSHTAGQTLTLPTDVIVTSLVYRSGYLYVGTKTDDGEEAKVYVWNGSTSNADISIPMGASWVLCLVPYLGTVAGITNEGEIFAISGTSKQHLGGLPIFYAAHKRWFSSSATVNSVVLSAGMDCIGDVIYITVEGSIANDTYLYGMKDGVWVYDPQVGVYHYATPTVDVLVTDNALTRDGNTLTTSSAHNLVTGDPISFHTTNGLVGVSNIIVYYAIVTGATTIQLAGTRYDADLGQAIPLSGTPDTSDILVYAENTDKGSILGGNPGALKVTNHRTVASPLLSTDMVYGFEPLNLASTTESTLQTFIDSYNVSWFSTQKIYTQNINEIWKSVTVFLNGLHYSNEKMIVKYRTVDRKQLPTDEVSGVWSSTTEITTTDFKVRGNVQVGDEVVFTRGYGQGQTAHITNIELGKSYTKLTLDETYGFNTGNSTFIVTGYKKAQEITSNRTHVDRVTVSLDSAKASCIQIKVEMRGYGIEVPMLELSHSVEESVRK